MKKLSYKTKYELLKVAIALIIFMKVYLGLFVYYFCKQEGSMKQGIEKSKIINTVIYEEDELISKRKVEQVKGKGTSSTIIQKKDSIEISL